MCPDIRGRDFPGQKENKTCPKCGAELLKSPTNFFLPSALPSVEARAVADVYAAGGLMVRAFVCPKCDYVEFYIVKHERL
jgi:ribosomal protein S27AE